jgi:hypothetical protein
MKSATFKACTLQAKIYAQATKVIATKVRFNAASAGQKEYSSKLK